MIRSGLFAGVVTHRRARPVVHGLRYRIFMLLLDLDEAAGLSARLRLFGFDRAALLSFRQVDHGNGMLGALRAWVEQHVQAAGLETGGAIRVLCMPRVLGFAFNPLTVYFCHAPDGRLSATIYEVNNTFGQRHGYLLPVDGRPDLIVQECGKAFHVSPFMGMDLRYRFRIRPPGEDVSVGIQVLDAQGPVLAASFAGTRHALTDRAILRAVLAMPLQGAKVLGGIHWEAVKLWCKGLRLRPSPPAPVSAMSLPAMPRLKPAGAAASPVVTISADMPPDRMTVTP